MRGVQGKTGGVVWQDRNENQNRALPSLHLEMASYRTRTLSGVALKLVEMVRELIEKTHTATGRWVRAHVLDKVYPQGEKCSKDWKEQTLTRIIRDDLFPDWNYCVHPA